MRGAASSTSRRRWFVPGGRCGAYARRRADAKVVAALDSSIRTAASAMRDVERLKRQRKILAQQGALQRGRLDLAARLIEAMRRREDAGATDDLRTIQRQAEEIALLRDEVSQLSRQLLDYSASISADTNASRSESWELAKRLRDANKEIVRLHRQRRVLARHLYQYVTKDRAMRMWLDHLFAGTGSPWHPFDMPFRALRTAFRWALKWAERIALALVAGRRNGAEMQEAING